MDPILSPDGTIRVELVPIEMRMSHTVFNTVVTHLPTGDVLLDTCDTLWDAGVAFETDGRLTLDLREYPGTTPGFKATINPTTLEVRTRAFGDPESEPMGTLTLEDLWACLAPRKRVSQGVLRRRHEIEGRKQAQAESARTALRAKAEAAERARADEIAQARAEAERQAEADRLASAERVRREKEAAERLMLDRLDETLKQHALGRPSLPPPPAPTAPSVREAAHRFDKALAGMLLTFGTIGLYLGAFYVLTWAIAVHTPLSAAPWWIAWPVGLLVSTGLLFGIPYGLLVWAYRSCGR